MKTYICECGKEFDNAQKFNGHKSHCRTHQLSKYDIQHLESIIESRNAGNIKGAKLRKEQYATLKLSNQQQWVNEQHQCEHCGKVMTEKFGSGRFCSRECANSRNHSETTKSKIKSTASMNGNQLKSNNILDYESNPKYCLVCHAVLDYKHRRCKTCCVECKNQLISQELKLNPNVGGLRQHSGTGKSGYYRGFYCASTYELVYIIYNLDNNINFLRCPTNINYEYQYKNKKHKYYPDFLLSDGSLIEIKGYHTEIVDLKLSAVTDRHIDILYKKDLQYAFDYVKETYEYKKLTDLYDK